MPDTMASEAAPAPSPATPAPTAAPPTGEIISAPMSSAPEAAAPKQGAPAANGNHLAAGLHSDPQKQLVRLVLGSLGDSQARVETDAYSYRRTLEEACLEANGEITLVHAHAIDAATRWMRHGQLALAWLREHEPKMDHAQRLAYSKAIAEAADRRDKSVERLQLDAEKDPFGPLPLIQPVKPWPPAIAPVSQPEAPAADSADDAAKMPLIPPGVM